MSPDYGNGTGHGVGHFLNVHEGPMRMLSIRSAAYNSTPLKPGMKVSNCTGFISPSPVLRSD
jgi:Xaa-Pro aminopeptidase